ncbi:hypothetical protein SLS62_003697 [Diatrype stigma]|uniref:Endoglucanase B n=1 Tax=Diatrype stigma TaxID=117547 RepID=A0AAN9US48_9PEZI
MAVSKSSALVAVAASLVLTVSGAPARRTANCSSSFEPITAADYVAAINPGWNVGNSLDAIPNEDSWNNGLVQAETFDDVKAAGFKSVRLPVTYTHHFTGESPDWTIDPDWLQRVSDVVDMAVERDLYVITNVHHDSWEWADVTQADANLTLIEEKMYRTWFQIGEKLGCKSSLVAFEPINEPPAETAEHGAELNKINKIFLQALADSGGFNTQRVVTLVGGAMDSVKTSQWFEAPTGFDNPWAIQYHYYSPWDAHTLKNRGKTILSEADLATITADLTNIRNNFTDVPLVIGEFDASPGNTEPAARRRYTDLVARTAASLDTAVVLWDNGLDHLDRTTHTWRDPHSLAVLINAAAEQQNSLADATTDAAATTQSSSAYVFHKAGDAAADSAITVALNGNTLQSITVDGSDSAALTEGTDYTATAEGEITFATAFLEPYVGSAEPGSKANLTLAFSAGATAGVEIVVWDLPVLEATSSKAVGGQDLLVPVQFRGLSYPAAVKMLRSDGVFLFDDWTQYLGPLQAAYGTWSGQWNWLGNNIVLTAATVDAVIAAGVDTTFTFDFYPRGPGNSLNYTLTV